MFKLQEIKVWNFGMDYLYVNLFRFVYGFGG